MKEITDCKVVAATWDDFGGGGKETWEYSTKGQMVEAERTLLWCQSHRGGETDTK